MMSDIEIGATIDPYAWARSNNRTTALTQAVLHAPKTQFIRDVGEWAEAVVQAAEIYVKFLDAGLPADAG